MVLYKNIDIIECKVYTFDVRNVLFINVCFLLLDNIIVVM